MSDHQFIKSYLDDFIELLKPNDHVTEQLIHVRNLLLKVKEKNKKVEVKK